METPRSDIAVVRGLAERYAEAAAVPVQKERMERYRDSNSLKAPLPILLIDEIPWGEMDVNGDLTLRCKEELCRQMEWYFRSWLYRWDHLQADLVLPAYFPVPKCVRSTGFGFTKIERTIESTTGSDIRSHEYVDQLQTEADLERFRLPTLTYDRAATEGSIARAQETLGGALPVKLTGMMFSAGPWDTIAELRGVSNLLLDLSDRPDFMRRIMEKLTEIHLHTLRQMEELNLLEPDPIYIHCTPACTHELPPAALDPGAVRARDVWGRYVAQIFGSVSPQMHDEFDLTYAKRITRDCGLLYYGCCEPLDAKVDRLRQFPNLRKISITPWANVDRAADAIGSDYVLSYKPNPAFVAVDAFDEEPVRKEISRALRACRRNGTTCELILKDISSVRNHPENLVLWERAAMDQIAREW